MKRADVMRRLLQEISEAMELDEEDILSNGKSESIVDARHLLIVLLFEYGFYPKSISQLIGCSKRNVNVVLASFFERCKSRKMLRINYEIIRKKVGISSL